MVFFSCSDICVKKSLLCVCHLRPCCGGNFHFLFIFPPRVYLKRCRVRNVLSTAPPFISWWSNLEILFGPLHSSSPFRGELWWFSERFVAITKQLQAAKCSLNSQLFGHIPYSLHSKICYFPSVLLSVADPGCFIPDPTIAQSRILF
jgi:hypothetical protein